VDYDNRSTTLGSPRRPVRARNAPPGQLTLNRGGAKDTRAMAHRFASAWRRLVGMASRQHQALAPEGAPAEQRAARSVFYTDKQQNAADDARPAADDRDGHSDQGRDGDVAQE